MSNEGFKDKIKTEILKSGFPLELFCQQKVLENNWSIIMNKQYVNSEGDYREIDIEAYRQDELLVEKELRLSTSILIECKKNHANPWVFFPQKTSRFYNLNIAKDAYKDSYLFAPELFQSVTDHHYKTTKDYSRDYIIPFKHENPRENRQIFDSVTSVIDYYKYHGLTKKRASLSDHIHQYYFVVVYDGQMFTADVKSEDDIQVEETNHVILGVSQTYEEGYRHYSVDIVHKDYFSNYLKLIEADCKYIQDYLIKCLI